MPSSFALSADAIRSRSLIVSNSMSSRLIATSPATTIPLSRTRSRTSARLDPPPGAIARPPDPPDHNACSLALIALAPHISPDPLVADEVAVGVELALVGREDVRGGRDPLQLHDVDAHAPPLAVPGETGNGVGRPAGQRSELLLGPADEGHRPSVGDADAAVVLFLSHRSPPAGPAAFPRP